MVKKKPKVEKKRVVRKLVAKKPVVKKPIVKKRVLHIKKSVVKPKVEKPTVSHETPKVETPEAKEERIKKEVAARKAKRAEIVNETKPKKERLESKLEPKLLPVWEGKQVLKIRDDGRELKDYYHCDLQDGTTSITAHVPKRLFS